MTPVEGLAETAMPSHGLGPEAMAILVTLLTLFACVGLFHALFQGTLSGRRAALRRLSIAVGVETAVASGTEGSNEQRRKQSIEKALNELAQRERNNRRARLTLKMRLNQAALPWSVGYFYAVSVGVAGGFLLLLMGIAGMSAPPAGVLSLFAGAVLPNLYVRMQFRRRMREFVEEFPNALDIITRGIKTGLPLSDCLKAIAAETQEPVAPEFQKILEDLSVGLSVSQSLDRLTQRVPILEAQFFSIVVALQSQMGGNLSEALGNLSRVLRERKMMKQKIKAFSSEATASGSIIASMPVAVSGVLSLTSPDYIGLMFSEPIGNVVLGVCAVWMAIGVTVMRNMIRFDF